MISQRIVDRVRYAVPFRRRRQAKLALVRLRAVGGAAFSLPDFLIIGAMRAGTSSLFKYLAQHPELYRSQRKEVEYFTNEHARGERWYRAHFAPIWSRKRSYEACPSYLFHPLAPRRASTLLPEAKLIVLLRDPAERAYSHWQHMTRLGFETLPFADAVAAEPTRTRTEAALVADGSLARSKSWERFSYVARGFYAEQIARWRAVYPAEAFHLVQFDDLIADPLQTLDRLCDFLGIARFVPADLRNFSTAGRGGDYGKPRQRGAEEARAIDQLRHVYEDDQRRLSELIGRPG